MTSKSDPKQISPPQAVADPKKTFLRSRWILFTIFIISAIFVQDYFIGPRFSAKVHQIDEKARLAQNATFEDNCRPRNYKRHLIQNSESKDSVCVCKPYQYWKAGCASKLELFSKKPFVLKVHRAFEAQTEEISKYADLVTMRPVMFGGELGNSWVSPYINSEDGVLKGDLPIVQRIYTKVGQLIGMIYPCGNPGAAIVRYKQGGFVGLHYDAPDLRVEKKLGFYFGGHIVRSLVGWLEDCRHFYSKYNIWKCLYLASRGKLESSTSWNNYEYGPQIATILIQLSKVKGGETFFPLVNLTVPTSPGDVVVWGNIGDDWHREPKSMHGGCPVLSKEKLIVVGFMSGKCNTFEGIIKNLREPANIF